MPASAAADEAVHAMSQQSAEWPVTT
jgi:hypothetical protein